MRTIFVLLFVSAAFALTPAEEFRNFIVRFRKQYPTYAERQARFEIFQVNLKEIARLNAEKSSATFGVTPFSDLTQDEFFRKMTMKPRLLKTTAHSNRTFVGDVPINWDWRDKEAVTIVKDQGNCGSCWAFGVSQNAESVWAVAGNTLSLFSAQQLLDCEIAHSLGCDGGYPDYAAQSIVDMGGIMLEEDYPYEIRQGKCRFDAGRVRGKFSGAEAPKPTDVSLKEYIYNVGAIEMAVYATPKWQAYTGGILEQPICEMANHSVLGVGYGVDKATQAPYWIIKNSWGSNWGEKGYIRVTGKADCLAGQTYTVIV